jgi:hypothetical protein
MALAGLWESWRSPEAEWVNQPGNAVRLGASVSRERSRHAFITLNKTRACGREVARTARSGWS